MRRRNLLVLSVVGALAALAVAAPLVLALKSDDPISPQIVVAPGRDSFAVVTRAGATVSLSVEPQASEVRAQWFRTGSFPWLERDSFHRALLLQQPEGSSIEVGDATLHIPSRAHLRVVFVGDTGAGEDAERVLRQAAEQQPDVVVHVGDVAYAFGDERAWDAWTDLAARELPGIPIAYVTGNHDVESGLDRAQMSGLRGGETRYSFDLGPVHFVVLDSNAVTDAEAAWLAADLDAAKAAGARWIVPVEHHPWYSSGTTHGSNLAAREKLASLFASRGVKLAVAGHEHNYERTRPIEGVTYVVTGGGGATLYADFAAKPEWWSAARHQGHELLRVDFTADAASAKAIKPDGTVVDEFTL